MTYLCTCLIFNGSVCIRSCAIQADIAVKDMMTDVQAAYPERRQMLIDLLGVDVNWRMHQVSDGQRRRVQIVLQLLRPSTVLLLDEVRQVGADVRMKVDFWVSHLLGLCIVWKNALPRFTYLFGAPHVMVE